MNDSRPDSGLFQVVYVSTASQAFQEDQDIDKILHCAYERNHQLDVTGMLLFKGGVFIQLLEGQKEHVTRILGSIAGDLRHKNINVIVNQPATERLFADWTMGYVKVSDLDIETVRDVLQWDEITEAILDGEKIANDRIMSILKAFRFRLKPAHVSTALSTSA